jgi:hypothetical protein
VTRQDGSLLCRFQTQEQCMQSRSGRGDSCVQDSSTQATPSKARTSTGGAAPSKKTAPETATKAQPDAVKVKEQPAKQVAPTKAPTTPTPQTTTPQDPAQKFAAARDLVLAGKYEDGIAALRALGFDEHPDVATYVGLALNKLGYKAEASAWYDKALAGNPKHLLTLSYYGMLRAEQGDLANAQKDLEAIKAVCGSTTCKEYVALEGVIASKKR